MEIVRLVLFTRLPVPGAAKTRLIPALGAAGAAAVHRQLTERTVATLRRVGGHIEVHFTGGDVADFSGWLGDDIALVRQPEGDLTARLLAAIDPAPVIFFGSDTPDLSEGHVASAVAALKTSDVVIGPADDGGYYLIGVARPFLFLFEDMPWSTEFVLPETVDRLRRHAVTFELLEVLHDCDRPEDLDRWPWLTR